jgi:hypothetical protein
VTQRTLSLTSVSATSSGAGFDGLSNKNLGLLAAGLAVTTLGVSSLFTACAAAPVSGPLAGLAGAACLHGVTTTQRAVTNK